MRKSILDYGAVQYNRGFINGLIMGIIGTSLTIIIIKELT